MTGSPLERLTKAELLEMARQRGIRGRSRMTKADLLAAAAACGLEDSNYGKNQDNAMMAITNAEGEAGLLRTGTSDYDKRKNKMILAVRRVDFDGAALVHAQSPLRDVEVMGAPVGHAAAAEFAMIAPKRKAVKAYIGRKLFVVWPP